MKILTGTDKREALRYLDPATVASVPECDVYEYEDGAVPGMVITVEDEPCAS